MRVYRAEHFNTIVSLGFITIIIGFAAHFYKKTSNAKYKKARHSDYSEPIKIYKKEEKIIKTVQQRDIHNSGESEKTKVKVNIHDEIIVKEKFDNKNMITQTCSYGSTEPTISIKEKTPERPVKIHNIVKTQPPKVKDKYSSLTVLKQKSLADKIKSLPLKNNESFKYTKVPDPFVLPSNVDYTRTNTKTPALIMNNSNQIKNYTDQQFLPADLSDSNLQFSSETIRPIPVDVHAAKSESTTPKDEKATQLINISSIQPADTNVEDDQDCQKPFIELKQENQSTTESTPLNTVNSKLIDLELPAMPKTSEITNASVDTPFIPIPPPMLHESSTTPLDTIEKIETSVSSNAPPIPPPMLPKPLLPLENSKNLQLTTKPLLFDSDMLNQQKKNLKKVINPRNDTCINNYEKTNLPLLPKEHINHIKNISIEALKNDTFYVNQLCHLFSVPSLELIIKTKEKDIHALLILLLTFRDILSAIKHENFSVSDSESHTVQTNPSDVNKETKEESAFPYEEATDDTVGFTKCFFADYDKLEELMQDEAGLHELAHNNSNDAKQNKDIVYETKETINLTSGLNKIDSSINEMRKMFEDFIKVCIGPNGEGCLHFIDIFYGDMTLSQIQRKKPQINICSMLLLTMNNITQTKNPDKPKLEQNYTINGYRYNLIEMFFTFFKFIVNNLTYHNENEEKIMFNFFPHYETYYGDIKDISWKYKGGQLIPFFKVKAQTYRSTFEEIMKYCINNTFDKSDNKDFSKTESKEVRIKSGSFVNFIVDRSNETSVDDIVKNLYGTNTRKKTKPYMPFPIYSKYNDMTYVLQVALTLSNSDQQSSAGWQKYDFHVVNGTKISTFANNQSIEYENSEALMKRLQSHGILFVYRAIDAID